MAYREDTDEVIGYLRDAFAELYANSDHAPKIIGELEVRGITSLGDSAVNIRARIKTLPGSQWAIGREYNRLVKRHLDAAGVEIPFPHTTIYFGEDKHGKAPPAHLQVAHAKDALPPVQGTAIDSEQARSNPKHKGDFDDQD